MERGLLGIVGLINTQSIKAMFRDTVRAELVDFYRQA